MTSLGNKRKQDLDDLLENLKHLHKREPLLNEIETALKCPAPSGDPEYIAGVAHDYAKASSYIDDVHKDVRAVARVGLPSVYVGEAGSKASEVTDASAYSADQMAEKLKEAAAALRLLSIGVREAKMRHNRGLEDLRAARSYLGYALTSVNGEAEKAREFAQEGVRMMRSAVERAEAAGERAARELDRLSSEARAEKFDSDALSPAARITLAATAAYGGVRDESEILTANDLRRIANRMEKMRDVDRKGIDEMLEGAKSPQERAYVMKALAAGYYMGDVREFRDKIHPFGDDPKWLQQHLTPIVNGPGDSKAYGSQADVSFGSQRWEQQGTTCVAMSTVTTHATVDPLYALELTTGGHPGDPDFDDPEAFEERLRMEESRLYEEREWDKMNGDDAKKINNSEIAPHIGRKYADERFAYDDDGMVVQQREAALPKIHDALNEGVPVPLSVEGDPTAEGYRRGHSVMIIGQEGDKLQIYDPEGFTTWVSEDQFVNGKMADDASKGYPRANGIRLPQ